MSRYIPSRPRRAHAGIAPSAQAMRRSDSKFSVFLVAATYWLLVTRVIVPGFFDYGPNVNYAEMIARDAIFNKVTWLTFLGVGAFFTFSRMGAAMRLFRATNPMYFLMLGFAILSVLWSIDSSSSMAHLFRFLTIVLCCSAVTLVGWHRRRFQDITRPIFTILLLASLIFGLVAPDLAVTQPVPPDTKYYWHGLAPQKNGLGALGSMGTILWFHGWAAREVKPWAAIAWGGVSVACLVLSRSSTSLMATIFVCFFLLLWLRSTPAMRRYMPYIVGIFAAITLTYTLAVLKVVPGLDALLTPITALTGKDTTFTARTQIWDITRAHISQSPALGTGYGGFWTGPLPGTASYIFVYKMYFYPNESHNGYLDIINDLGYVGLLILLGYIWTYIRQSLRLLRINYSQAGLYLGMLFQQLLTNMSETHWFFNDNDFVMLTLATLCLGRDLLQRGARPSVYRQTPQQPRSTKSQTVS